MSFDRHHPAGDVLMSFAAGALDGAVSTVVRCHLELCLLCRDAVGTLESVGGQLVESLDPGPEDHGFFERTMARFAQIAAEEAKLAAVHGLRPGDEYIMPGQLADLTGLRRQTIPWGASRSGIRAAEVFVPKLGKPLHFLEAGPGASFRESLPGRDPIFFILWGDFQAAGEGFRRGDLVEVGEDLSGAFLAGQSQGVTMVLACQS